MAYGTDRTERAHKNKHNLTKLGPEGFRGFYRMRS